MQRRMISKEAASLVAEIEAETTLESSLDAIFDEQQLAAFLGDPPSGDTPPVSQG